MCKVHSARFVLVRTADSKDLSNLSLSFLRRSFLVVFLRRDALEGNSEKTKQAWPNFPDLIYPENADNYRKCAVENRENVYKS